MSASFTRIDYSLRPAKHAERRMLCDIFRRLRPFGRVEDYVYVGFGSVWFSDFALFHRSLGIKEMVSIEQEVADQQRFEDNKPFRIAVDYRPSHEALPNLSWGRNQFLWLDYDDPLSSDMLQDIRTVATRSKSGTVLAVSVQCMRAPHVAHAKQDPTADALTRFIGEFSPERVPQETTEEQLFGWPYGELSRAMILWEIEAALATRNSSGTEAEMLFQPIAEIEYEDGAKMTTVVGIFYSSSDTNKLAECHFDTLEFRQSPPRPIRISVPKLTSREFRMLESQLPLAPENDLVLGSMPEKDARQFLNMYRYLPNFAVLEG
jgi:hypothetical protein